MNKKYFNIVISLIILFFLLEIFNHSNIINNAIINSSKIWFYNIIPSIFPIYIIVDLLLNYGILDYISNLFKPLMNYIFKMKKQTSFVFIMSMLSGFPSNSKYIKSLLDNNIINIHDANKLLVFTHFSNPLFIINSIGNNFLNNQKIGIIILICHYITNIILGFLNRNSYLNLENTYKKVTHKKSSFITTLTNSIFNTIKILVLLYGIITVFMIISSVLYTNLPINPFFKSIISGILEITGGIYYVSLLNINIIYKASLITFFISFGGISIHMQVLSILEGYKIKYLDYIKFRLIHAIVSTSLVYTILTLI